MLSDVLFFAHFVFLHEFMIDEYFNTPLEFAFYIFVYESVVATCHYAKLMTP